MTRLQVPGRTAHRRVVVLALALVAGYVVRLTSSEGAAAETRDVAAPVSAATPAGCPRAQVLLTAHRGTGLGTRTLAGRAYSEDTIPAFRAALAAGADAVELDYWPTSDGRIVVHHDPTLDRMTDGHDRIDAHTWSEVAQLRHPSGAGIPSLEQVITALESYDGDRQQEIKNGAAFDDGQLGRLVRTDVASTPGAYQRLLYTSTTLRTLARIHAIDPRVPLGLITRAPDARPALERLPDWLDVVLIDLRAADSGYVRQAAQRGYAVSVRGVDTVAQLHAAADIGAQRVLTNRPEVLGRAC